MKWPWVSRTEHRALREELFATFKQWQVWEARCVAAEARYDALLEKYHALRIEGSVMHPSVPAGVPSDAVERAASAIVRMAAEPDELKSLIHDLCGTDYRKRAMMLRQLAADRAANVSDDRLRALIINGIEGNGVPS